MSPASPVYQFEHRTAQPLIEQVSFRIAQSFIHYTKRYLCNLCVDCYTVFSTLFVIISYWLPLHKIIQKWVYKIFVTANYVHSAWVYISHQMTLLILIVLSCTYFGICLWNDIKFEIGNMSHKTSYNLIMARCVTICFVCIYVYFLSGMSHYVVNILLPNLVREIPNIQNCLD